MSLKEIYGTSCIRCRLIRIFFINFAYNTEEQQRTERLSLESVNGYRPEYVAKRASICSIIENIPPKGVGFSDFICIFAMSSRVFIWLFGNTKTSENSDMANCWATFCCFGAYKNVELLCCRNKAKNKYKHGWFVTLEKIYSKYIGQSLYNYLMGSAIELCCLLGCPVLCSHFWQRFNNFKH